jgi:hypothetical protein
MQNQNSYSTNVQAINKRRMGASLKLALVAALSLLANASFAQSFFFNTGAPDGKMASASRTGSPGRQEIESADDFILPQETLIRQATFTGLLPAGTTLDNISEVAVEIYRVFTNDSVLPPSGSVPTRNNSPSDVAFDARGSEAGNVFEKLTYEVAVVADNFTASNSVLNGINPLPTVRTLGEGPVSGIEVQFSVTFPTPFDLPANHYFFIPQVRLNNGDFFWLSAPRPIRIHGRRRFDSAPSHPRDENHPRALCRAAAAPRPTRRRWR